MDSNYEILEQIGVGSNTVVYRAFDTNLKRYVALKKLADGASEQQRTRFVKQVQFLAGVDHPNVIKVHAFDAQSGAMVMELLSGSLRDRIAQGKTPANVALSVLKQSLEALDYLHKLNLVHGSIRPSNLLIDDDGKVKLSDFVLAESDGGIAAPEPNLCKYIPPEIWDENKFGPVGQAMDLYCLGLTLLECLSGRGLEDLIEANHRGQKSDVFWARWHTSLDHSDVIKRLVGKSLGNKSELLISLLAQKSTDRPASASSVLGNLSNVGFAPLCTNTAESAIQPIPGESDEAIDQNKWQAPFETSNSKTPITKTDRSSGKPAWLPQKWDLNDKIAFRWALGSVMLTTAIVYSLYLSLSGPALYELALSVKPEDAIVTLSDPQGNKRKVSLAKGIATLKLPSGQYKLSAIATDFDEINESITLDDELKGRAAEKEIVLLPSKVSIVIETTPPDAQLMIEQSKVARDSSNSVLLKPGTYKLFARKDGFVDSEEQRIQVDKNSSTISLKPLLAKVTISIEPDGTRIRDNGIELRPITPGTSEYSIATGTRTLKFEKDGYESIEKKFSIIGGMDVMVSLKELPSQPVIPKAPPTSSIALSLVWCPPGTFMMGSPLKQVETKLTKGFWIGSTEITQAQWKLVMGTTPWTEDPESVDGPSYPASSISRIVAAAFCEKLTERERTNGSLPKGTYRLPTEAEWEYACRAGTKTEFSFGDATENLEAYGWTNSNKTHAQEVGKLKPNPFGIYDMHGNLWEWCLDSYAPNLLGGEDPVGPAENGSTYVIRGGSFLDSANDARSAHRAKENGDTSTGVMGFRVVLTE